MKGNKGIIIVGIILCLAIVGIGVYGLFFGGKDTMKNDDKKTTVSLEQIAEKFKTATTPKSYIDFSLPFSVEIEKQSLIIQANEKEYKYNLDNSILSITLPKDNMDGIMMTFALIDSIEQLHGYEDGQIIQKLLNITEMLEYKIDRGIEIVYSENNITIKVDINKRLELIDFSNYYIETKDLANVADFIKGEGCIQKNKGYVILHKCGSNEEAIITIGEKDSLTNNTYKTLLSVVEIIFGAEEKNNFASVFPKIENKTHERYNLIIDPQLDEDLSVVFPHSNYKIIQLKITK